MNSILFVKQLVTLDCHETESAMNIRTHPKKEMQRLFLHGKMLTLGSQYSVSLETSAKLEVAYFVGNIISLWIQSYLFCGYI